jgi:UDP-N-acetylenolpyruvoylglucosamine reductase
VWAESGANLGGIARQAALRNLSGLEWATTVPGTVGGAVFGNAGAFGSNTAASLKVAEILHPIYGKQEWPVENWNMATAQAGLKRNPGQVIILAARFELSVDNPEAIQARMSDFSARGGLHTHRAPAWARCSRIPRATIRPIDRAAGLKALALEARISARNTPISLSMTIMQRLQTSFVDPNRENQGA